MLRGLVRHTFMTMTLANTVRQVLEEAGLEMTGVISIPGDRILWTLPDPAARQAAHDALHPAGLVWEAEWADIEAYRPVHFDLWDE